jgi:hypothetical protein
MADPTALCPNCHVAWPEGASVCPHCGYVRSAPSVWPPPPSQLIGVPHSPPPGPKLVTGKVWGDLTLGIGISFASNFFYCLGLLVMPILYFMLRANYPVFARGIGFGFVAGLVLLLGALVWCFSGLANIH